jgi:hypothetical protein
MRIFVSSHIFPIPWFSGNECVVPAYALAGRPQTHISLAPGTTLSSDDSTLGEDKLGVN